MSLNDLIDADVGSVFFNTADFGLSASVSRKAATVTMTTIIDTQEVRTRGNNAVVITRNWLILLVQASVYNFGDGIVAPITIDHFTVGSRKFQPRKVTDMGQCWEYTDGTSGILKIFVEEVSA